MAAEEKKDQEDLESETEEDEEKSSDNAEGEDGSAAAEPKSKRKKIIIIALIALMLIVISLGGFLYFQKEEKIKLAKQQQQKQLQESEVFFYDLEPMMVNLSSGTGRSEHYLKIQMSFEVKGSSNLNAVKKFSTKIQDVMQLYLRELTTEDMRGSIGLYMLRDELLLRVNKIIHPAHVDDILFKDVLVQ